MAVELTLAEQLVIVFTHWLEVGEVPKVHSSRLASGRVQGFTLKVTNAPDCPLGHGLLCKIPFRLD